MAWFILHAAFELVENTPTGMQVIRLIKFVAWGQIVSRFLIEQFG